jgi:hypothetical protein
MFNDHIGKIYMEQKKVIIMGDFNVNYVKKKTHEEFKSIITLNGFKQPVKTATRVTSESSTLINLVFLNRPCTLPYVIVVSTSICSDHDMVSCIRKINFLKYRHRTIKCRNYANDIPVNLVNDAWNINCSRILENNSDANAAVNYFTAQMKALFDNHAPIVEKRVKGTKPCEWLDDTVKKEIHRVFNDTRLNPRKFWKAIKSIFRSKPN